MQPRFLLIVFYSIFLIPHTVNSARIIFLFAGGNLSHKISIWPLVYNLAAERNHKITFISSSSKIIKSHPNIKDITPIALEQATKNVYTKDRFKVRNDGEEHKVFTNYPKFAAEMCKLTLNVTQTDPELNTLLKPRQYDLAIINSLFGECGILIANYLGCKFIAYTATTTLPYHIGIYGVPMPGSWIPNVAIKLNNYPMNLWDRLQNVISYHEYESRHNWFMLQLEELMRNTYKLESVPSYVEMERNASLIFINSHPAIDFARAYPPNFVNIGGMQCRNDLISGNSSEALPKELQAFMDNNAYDGLILIAFGSTLDLSTIPEYYKNLFFSSMRKFSSIGFIMRWKGELPENSPNNLYAAEWLPQKQILSHPKTKAFMTHCGQNSMAEATCYGIPLLAVPLFGDQDLIAYRIVAQKLGVKLEIVGLTQEILNSGIQEVIYNPTYKTNMKTRSMILKDQPNPIETAVFWTEFVLKHDDLSAFKSMELEQSIFVRNMVDVYFVIFIICFVVPLILMYFILVCIRKLF